MSRFDIRFRDHPDFHLIVDPHPDGPVIGVYADHPISVSVADYFGRHFTFAGVAPRLRNGQYDVAALRAGEFIVRPGLLYRVDSAGDKGGMRRLIDSVLPSTASSRSVDRSAQDIKTGLGHVAPSGDGQAEECDQRTIPPEQKRQAQQQVLASFAAFIGFVLLAHFLLAVLNVG